MGAAYRMLAYRDRSIEEVRAGLAKKEFDEKTIATVIEELEGKSYLDDSKFAANYGRYLAVNKKVGPHYLVRALSQKGVDREIAKEAAEGIYPDKDAEKEEIKKLVEKRIKTYKKSLTPLQKKKRTYDLLLRRGFSHDAVAQIIGQWKF